MAIRIRTEDELIRSAMAILGRRGGVSRSEAKTKSSRENGKYGGRPPNKPVAAGVIDPDDYRDDLRKRVERLLKK